MHALAIVSAIIALVGGTAGALMVNLPGGSKWLGALCTVIAVMAAVLLVVAVARA